VGGSLGQAAEPSTVDFDAEIRLAADVIPAEDVTPVSPDPGDVFLTGATGFVGAFLLRELMRSTNAKIHCLVRAENDVAAFERLRTSLSWYRLWDEIDTERLVVVVGDLARPRLGLSPEEFDRLARTIDAIYHAGANVNWIQSYPALKAANVTGTEEVLRLAALHRTVPVHHISSTGVFSSTEGFARQAGHGADLLPEDPAGPGAELLTGYAQSKYVAERIIDIARSRGLPVTVYRADVVCGDQRNGACQTHDLIWLSLKGAIQAKGVPAEINTLAGMVPVDYVAAAVVTISRTGSATGRTFHLQNRKPSSLREMVGGLRDFGYQLSDMTWADFDAIVRTDRENAILPVIDTLAGLRTLGDSPTYIPVDVSATERALDGSGITCPAIDTELLMLHYRFFTESGYFPPTPRQ